MTDRILHIDFETASAVDLTKVGASRYSRDASTVVLCMAWAFDNDPVQTMTLPRKHSRGLPDDVEWHLTNGGQFAAWNANFETNLLENWFGISIDHHQAICTMQRALYAGLPAKLEKAGPALGLQQVKNMVGHRLMMKMSKPTKHGWFWHQDPVEGPAMLRDLALYCEDDVYAERGVSRFIQDLPASEKEVSRLDFEANRMGIRLDLPLIHKLIQIAADETNLLNRRCEALTSGAVTSPGTQTDRLVKWLRNEGVVIKSLGKADVAETLETPGLLPGLTQDVLEIRQQVAKSSTKKLHAMLKMVDGDGRVRGTLQYYGASRTGRFSGRMIQPQNFPRPEEYANDAIGLVLRRDIDADALRTFYGDPLTVVASCLRGCLIPTQGKVFFVYDLAQIEARVLAWLAAQKDVVKAFADYDKGIGPDVYTYTANKLNLGARQAGKVAVLGLGYGMGHVAFVDFAKGYGVTFTEQQSADIVFQWREANTEIRKFWWGLDAAAKTAIRSPGVEVSVGLIKIKVRDSYGKPVMLIRLPSGRVLYYRNPRLDTDPVQPQHESITFDGIDQWTKLWQPIRTWGSKLAENVTQAVARDVIVHGALLASGIPEVELVLSVHDELLFEVEPGLDFDYVRQRVEDVPAWAAGLPIKAGGKVLARYGKP